MDEVNSGRRARPWWLFLVAAVAVVAVAQGAARHSRDNATATPSPSTSQRPQIGAPPCTSADPIAALVIDPDGLGLGGVLERVDASAAVDGPWTVVVRRRDGSLGRNGAVVTFPVEAPRAGRPVDIGGAAGVVGDRMVVWPIAGAHARVRGDLTEAELHSVAEATLVIEGKPLVRPTGGLHVVSTGPYRPPSIRQVRYGSVEVGETEALGAGLTYTGVVTGGGFEDQLYAHRADRGGVVQCWMAIMSRVFGGSATLAWEPFPGIVAYVGYSGVAQDDESALAALQRLAGRSRALSLAEWQAARPDVLNQTNTVERS